MMCNCNAIPGSLCIQCVYAHDACCVMLHSVLMETLVCPALHKLSTAFIRHQAQAQEHDLEGAKTVHKMLHTAKAPADGGLALRGDEDDLDFGDEEDDEEDEGGDVEDMEVGNEEGEVEEI